MKGLVLAAGEGTRLSELHLKHKSFAEIHKKHVIDYSLDLLSEQKEYITEIVVVVGFHADSVMDYIGNEYKNVPVKYVLQEERKGIAHAIKVARDTLNDNFVLCLADEILFNPRLGDMLRLFMEKRPACICGVINDASDMAFKPIAYDLSSVGEVQQVREKPDHYSNDLRGVGECIFSRDSLELLEYLQPNGIRGEYEMGDWIQSIINNSNNEVLLFELADTYVNINRVRDIEIANSMFMD